MKLYAGKWYVAIRLGDLCIGLGSCPQGLSDQADRSRPHGGIGEVNKTHAALYALMEYRLLALHKRLTQQ